MNCKQLKQGIKLRFLLSIIRGEINFCLKNLSNRYCGFETQKETQEKEWQKETKKKAFALNTKH